MKLQVTLALICVFFPKALAVQCYVCQIGSPTDTCTDYKIDCPDQCISMTHFISYDGLEQQQSVKGCAAPEMCIRYSINLGVWKTNNNAKCCSTNFCNSETLPALSGSPNGRRCHTCVGNDCTKTLNCEGIEDRCITVNTTDGDTLDIAKGCASKSFCTASRSSIWGKKATATEISCCEGNLYNSDAGGNNSAAGVKMSLIIMLVPLLSSFL